MNLGAFRFGLAAVGMFAVGGMAFAAPVNVTGNVTPGVIYGTGGNANGSFTGETVDNIEVALRAHQRYPAENIYNYDGVDTYVFDSTVLTTNPANRSVFNFDWSINVDQSGLSFRNLADFSYLLSYDVDPGSAVLYVAIDPFNTSGYFDHSLGDNSTGINAGIESASNADLLTNMSSYSVAQQSSNLGFGFASDPDAPGIYNFRLEVFDGTILRASSEISVRVNPVPVPGALPLLASGIGIFGLAWRRRRRAAT